MAVLTITSTNPNLSYILEKNPSTQQELNAPFSRKIRKGMAYGWFTSGANEPNHQFRVWFKDADSEVSYALGAKAEFEYLDTTRYNTPVMIINILDSFFRTAYTKESEYDVADKGYTHVFNCECEITNRVMANRFFSLSSSDLGVREYSDGSLQFYSNTTVNHLLNFVLLFTLIQAAGDERFLDLRPESLSKYVRALNFMNAPFWMRHAFVKAAVLSQERLNAIAADLMPSGEFLLRYGNTQHQRYQFIKSQIQPLKDITVFDIGCGELSHAFKLVKNFEDKINHLYAFDKDAEIVESMESKISARQMTEKISICVKSSGFKDVVEEGSVVLLVELLEHMPLEEAKELLQDVLQANPSKIIITTPDRDFNKFYGMADGTMRHPDHHYEPTRDEFHTHFCSDLPEGYQAIYHYGFMDEVQGVTSNICVTISRKDAQ